MRVCACTVQFRDRRGVEHKTEVRASSVYEAACRAWAIFKSSEQTEEESYKAEEFVVDLWEESRTFHANLEKVLGWLDRGAARPQEHASQGAVEEASRCESLGTASR